jgi:hypothetical protein
MPDLIRHPDVVPTKVGNHLPTGSRFSPGILDSGFRRNDNLFVKPTIYGQTLIRFNYPLSPGGRGRGEGERQLFS